MGGKRSREDPASWPGREQKPLTVLNILLGLYEINTEVYGHGESLKTFEPSDAGTRREEFIRRRDRPLGIVRGQKALRPMGLSTLAGLVVPPAGITPSGLRVFAQGQMVEPEGGSQGPHSERRPRVHRGREGRACICSLSPGVMSSARRWRNSFWIHPCPSFRAS